MSLKNYFFIRFLYLLALLNLSSCSHLMTNQNPKKDDQYWSELVTESTQQKKSIIKILEKSYPALFNQIKKDAEDPTLLSFWGKSLNFDSGAKKKILNDELLTDLEAEFGIKNDNMIVHAGITHSYGYLFSTLETPYGFKRKRWVEPTLNYAFSFNGNALSPETIEGGLLSNITYFTGRLAFKNQGDRMHLLDLKNVSSEILNFDYTKLSVEILEEQIAENGGTEATLRTTLVHFPFKKSGEVNDYLLIYSIIHKNNNELLITAFPITKDAYKKIISSDSLGANQPIIVRYNAYLEGVMDHKLRGFRKFFQDSVR